MVVARRNVQYQLVHLQGLFDRMDVEIVLLSLLMIRRMLYRLLLKSRLMPFQRVYI